jgi:CRISPR/Cas system CSM-associated protein Csm3 (group 7 of RAMP superfamily)
MTKMRIEIQPLIIQTAESLAVGTGFRRGLVHRTVEQDADGFVYIPASSLKGRTRRVCEQLARQVGLRVCSAPRPNGMCSVHKQACLVCRVFGMPGRGSTLRWRDARLAKEYRMAFDSNREAQVYTRTQVQLSRALGTAAPDRLFASEFTVEGLYFESGITGWLEVTPIAGDDSTGGYELLLLLAGLRLVNTLGGQNSRGAGMVAIQLLDMNVKINDAEIPWKEVLENLDLLESFDEEVGNGG